jgi:hypothetical protein
MRTIEQKHENRAKEQRVVVIVEDGIVDSVYSDSPATVVVIDRDDHSDDREVFTLRDSHVEPNVVNILFNSMHDKEADVVVPKDGEVKPVFQSQPNKTAHIAKK